MSMRIGTERAQMTLWEKLYHFVHALDEAVSPDLVGRAQSSFHHVQRKVSHLEAKVRGLEARAETLKRGGK